MNFDYYDRVVIGFSGGKDSLACLLHCIESGCPLEKIELWHHLVDGNEGSTLMDWPVTNDYCRKVADHFDIPLYFSWREGGFEREMLRENDPTGDVLYVDVNGNLVRLPANKNKIGTRLKFPQVSADLSVRWCSAYLKIDVARRVLNNDLRFRDSKTLFITGERSEESAARAKYNQFEPHTCDARNGKLNRLIDWWRPVLHWTESKVWDIIKRFGINPHPAYRLGWGRVSCAACIFGRENQWASLKRVIPELFYTVAEYEEAFGVTIHRKKKVAILAADGTPYESIDDYLISLGKSVEFKESITVEPDEWELPAGAFSKESCGAI